VKEKLDPSYPELASLEKLGHYFNSKLDQNRSFGENRSLNCCGIGKTCPATVVA
jgi:hypothetical protein